MCNVTVIGADRDIYPAPGTPVPAPLDPEVVSFVIRQLQGGLFGKCLRTVLKVTRFRTEVKFNIKRRVDCLVFRRRAGQYSQST